MIARDRMPVFIREGLVLCLGAAVAGLAALLLQPFGNGWHLVHGILVPVVFCLWRASLAPRPTKDMTPFRQVVYQVLLAFALIMLLLFEIGMGVFAGLGDVPAVAWVFVVGFGLVYIVVVCITESMRRPALAENLDWS